MPRRLFQYTFMNSEELQMISYEFNNEDVCAVLPTKLKADLIMEINRELKRALKDWKNRFDAEGNPR